DLKDFGVLLVGVGVLALIAWFVWILLPDNWTAKIRYSVEYSVSTDHVHWSNPPTNCDWSRAPLGDKGCHYRKTVSAYNSKGDLVGGEDPSENSAPIYSTDVQSGRPIVSYDNRKTWDWLPAGQPIPDRHVQRVEIGWTR